MDEENRAISKGKRHTDCLTDRQLAQASDSTIEDHLL